MKRTGNLINQIADIDNLQLAFVKAVKGKQVTADAWCYRKHLDHNLKELLSEIKNNNVEIGNYHYFTIHDPKERKICAAAFKERVLHHALMNICHIHFEKFQINDSYASRKGKGTYAALDRAFLSVKKYKWFAKLDVRKYFDSIDHNILKQMLTKMYKDNQLLIILFDIIDSYQTANGKGLPIGNLTSQYFANHYLSKADHFLKEELKIPAYIRYMDDMVLFEDDREILISKVNKFIDFISTELLLEIKPICLNKTELGLPFLGYLLYPDKIRLALRSRKRFILKLKKNEYQLANNIITQKKYQNRVEPLVAFTNYANSKGFRRKFINTNTGNSHKGLEPR